MEIDAQLFIAIALIVGVAKLSGDLFDRMGMPSVLGELTAGILIGNLHLSGWHGLDFIATDGHLGSLAELGVVLLLFQVGLESNLHQMARVGRTAFSVASIGVIAPMTLGYGLHALLVPEVSWHVHLFIGAVLTATSVGITARVFKDLGRIDSPTGRVVLGAAVIDDVLGLIVLAVVAGVLRGAQTGEPLDVLGIVWIVAKAVGFLGAAIVLGRPVSRHLYRAAGVLRVRGVLLAATLAFCFAIAYLANLVGLAPIVGAFAAGLVLDELVYRDLATREDRPLETQIAPLGELLTPIFFVMTGAQVNLAALANIDALALAGALTAAAVIGKQACALVANADGVDRLSVGLGMIPRGEVGLIFAATGSRLFLDGHPVVGANTYAAIVLTVMVTSLITPPLLAWSLRRTQSSHVTRFQPTHRAPFYGLFGTRKHAGYVRPTRSSTSTRRTNHG